MKFLYIYVCEAFYSNFESKFLSHHFVKNLIMQIFIPIDLRLFTH